MGFIRRGIGRSTVVAWRRWRDGDDGCRHRHPLHVSLIPSYLFIVSRAVIVVCVGGSDLSFCGLEGNIWCC